MVGCTECMKEFCWDDAVCVYADNGNFAFDDEIPATVNLSSSIGRASSISLPPSLFRNICDNTTNSTGLVFTVYEKSSLFPVSRNNTKTTLAVTQVGTRIIAANVGQDTVFDNLQDPVIITLQLESQDKVGSYQNRNTYHDIICIMIIDMFHRFSVYLVQKHVCLGTLLFRIGPKEAAIQALARMTP